MPAKDPAAYMRARRATQKAREQAAATTPPRIRRPNRIWTAANLTGVTHVHDGIGWLRVVAVGLHHVDATTGHNPPIRLTFDQIVDTYTHQEQP